MNSATRHPQAHHQIGDPCGNVSPLGLRSPTGIATYRKDQGNLKMSAPFLDNGSSATILVDRVAGQMEGANKPFERHLWLMSMTDDADTVEKKLDLLVCKSPLDCVHQSNKRAHGWKAPGHGAGDRDPPGA